MVQAYYRALIVLTLGNLSKQSTACLVFTLNYQRDFFRVKQSKIKPGHQTQQSQLACKKKINHTVYPDHLLLVLDKIKHVSGENIAIYEQGISTTYNDLHDLSDIFIAKLACQSLKLGSLVGIYAQSNQVIIAAMLACMRSGYIFVPLDINFPETRIRYMIEHSQLACIISDVDNCLGEHCALLSLPVIQAHLRTRHKSSILRQGNALSVQHKKLPLSLPSLAGDIPVYVIYTSGTTGTPKGILVARNNIAIKLNYAAQYYQLTANDSVLCMVSCCTDTYIQQVFISLMAGARLCFSNNALLAPNEFFDYCIKNTINFTDLAPNFCLMLLDHEKSHLWWHESSLRILTLGGEELNKNIVMLWQQLGLFDKCRLINEYGPSEATVTSTIHTISSADVNLARIPIGSATADSQLLILNDQGMPCSDGEQGELYIGGSGVALGYLHDEKKSKEKFVWLTHQGRQQRYYRTGDYVSQNSQGILTFIGRTDNQVQLMGRRIELEEIEAVINKQKMVTDSAVILVEQRLFAFVTFSVQGSKTLREHSHVKQLRRTLLTELPAYMLPSKIIPLTRFPKTPVGKVDKKHCELLAKKSIKSYVNPQTTALVDIIASVLMVSVTDLDLSLSFKENGGDSLLAIAAFTALKNQRINILPWQLLQNSPLNTLHTRNKTANKIKITPDLIEVALPNKIALIESKNLSRWLINFALVVNTSVNLKRVQQVARILLRKYPALRLSFQLEPTPRQQLCTRINVEEYTYSDPSFERSLAWANAHFSAQQTTMNLRDKLWYIAVYNQKTSPEKQALANTRQDNKSVVFFSINHLLVDDLSLSYLSRDVNLLLTVPKLFSREVDTGLFYWQKQLFDKTCNGEFDIDKNYWRTEQVNQLPYIEEIMTGSGQKSWQLNKVKWRTSITKILLKSHELTAVKAHLKKSGCTIHHLLGLALITSCYRWSKQKKMSYACMVSGRHPLPGNADVSQSVGWFASEFPMSLELLIDLPYAEQIMAIQSQMDAVPSGGHSLACLRSYAEDTAFNKTMSLNTPRIKMTYENRELFDIDRLFNLEGALSITQVKSLSVDLEDPDSILYHFMGFSLYESQTEGLSVCFTYPSKLLDQDIAHNILADFADMVQRSYHAQMNPHLKST